MHIYTYIHKYLCNYIHMVAFLCMSGTNSADISHDVAHVWPRARLMACLHTLHERGDESFLAHVWFPMSPDVQATNIYIYIYTHHTLQL